MKKQFAAALTALGLLTVGMPGEAAAQGLYGPRTPGGVNSPVYSPYLNLLRRGNSPVANYFGLVRPELDVRRSLQTLQQDVTANRQSINTLETTPGTLVTGHAAYFLNTSHFYFSAGGQAGTSRTGAGLGATPPPRNKYSSRYR